MIIFPERRGEGGGGKKKTNSTYFSSMQGGGGKKGKEKKDFFQSMRLLTVELPLADEVRQGKEMGKKKLIF